ncbi:MAG TPA: phytanoyl-CoA dioxygenase family protein, partial [Pyrinomonadaceae bacterium]
MNTIAEDGFEIFTEVLTPEECHDLLSALQVERASGRAGSRDILQNDFVRRIANDERLRDIAARSLGENAVAYKAILFDKRNETNWLVPWHQDRVLPMKKKFVDPEWGPWTQKGRVDFAHAPAWAMNRVVALRIHLDDSTSENGPLRVIAGSHRYGVLDQS